MAKMNKLPGAFVLSAPDDALAPRTPAGTRLIMSRDGEPVPGVGVLVRDASGRAYLRRYAQGRAGQWLAQASNPAFATLESERDALKVLAVVTGRIDGAV